MTASPAYKDILTALCAGQHLSDNEMRALMNSILSGELSQAQTAGALIALKIKGEKPSELAAAATMMRELALTVSLPSNIADSVVDTCGTGGDGGGTFNISTAAAFVAAACGVRIAKHGNRALSGASGSSDVLQQLGMPLTATPAQVAELISEVGIGFMFAPNHHAAVKHVMPVRRELGVRTMFNMLGPLTNPAGVRRQVVGIFDRNLLLPYAETLAHLGALHALVVHGNGLDEISISGETDIAEVKNGMISRSTFAPEDVGLARADIKTIQVASAEESKDRILSVFAGDNGPARDVVLLNAAAALQVGGQAENFSDAVRLSAQAIDSGGAQKKLDDFIRTANAAQE